MKKKKKNVKGNDINNFFFMEIVKITAFFCSAYLFISPIYADKTFLAV